MSLREFEEPDGRRWRVWDTVPATTHGLTSDYRSGWLTFDNGGERRRLAPIPVDWERLAPERLGLLLRVARGRDARERRPAVAPLERERRTRERRAADRRRRDRRER
jgi:hypothetical protein